MTAPRIPGIASLLLLGTGVTGATAPPDDPAPMEVILVRGEQPGPALWKVTSGDHTLWILGTASPLPRKMKWRSRQFETQLAKSRELLVADTSGSWAKNRQEAKQVQDARQLHDGQTLKDILSPELYARVGAARRVWRVPDDLDALPPNAVGTHFANAAVWKLNLRPFGVTDQVAKLARESGVRTTSVPTPEQRMPLTESRENPVAGDTAPCLTMVLNAIDGRGIGMKRLANAWALGDIATLRELVPVHEISSSMGRQNPEGFACTTAALGSENLAREIVRFQTDAWLEESDRALRENSSTMAVVPLVELFADDGYLAGLRARGYEIQEPR